ncbi:CehA/McbA family metallohydrolase [Actinoplanes sp. NPDC024001]|uniref:CehA/McbA family metallohydrolase n=1 Tax=Actinoplanes sp. NPDC024001 TaxID=3154598 RepID=UPI0033EB05C5
MAGLRWLRGDLHVHSLRSHGGELTPEEVVAAAREAGLDFIAVTEHNTVDTYPAWAKAAGDDLTVIPGQEVVTANGHWLALGLPPGQVADWRYGVRDDLIDRAVQQVHDAGGLCVVAHPHAPYPSGTFMFALDGFDAVEVWNGLWASDLPWNADNEAALAEWGRSLAVGVHRGRWLPAVGNSDVHLRGQLGTPQTVVLAGDAGGVLAGVRAGHCWIAGSSEVRLSFTAEAAAADGTTRTAGIGQRLETGGRDAIIRLEVSGVPAGTVTLHTDRGRAHQAAASTVTFHTDRGRAHQTAAGTVTFHTDRGRAHQAEAGTVQWRTTAAESAFVRAEVRAPGGHMLALTNPILLA